MGYIDQGLSSTQPDSKYYSKFLSLKQQINEEKPSELKNIDGHIPEDTAKRDYGYIRWVDSYDKYGIIESGERKYFFVIADYREPISKNEFDNLIGKKVSFIGKKIRKKKSKCLQKIS